MVRERVAAGAPPRGPMSATAMVSPPRIAADSPTPSVARAAMAGGSGVGSLMSATARMAPARSMTSMTSDAGA